MIKFKKNDPITSFIVKYHHETLELNPSAAKFEEMLAAYEDNPLRLVAIGLCYMSKHPMRARGYLCAYDNLYKLGFDGDSLAILTSPKGEIQHHPLAIARLVARYVISRDYGSAAKLIASCPDETLKKLKENSGFVKNVIELTKITKSTLCYDILDLKSSEIDLLKNEVSKAISLLDEQGTSPTETYLTHVREKRFSAAEELSWLAYNAGERSEDFFEAVCQPLATELDISSRVMFFRIEAARCFTKNPKLIALGARAFMHSGEVSSAIELTSKAIENSIANSEILHLHFRASVILGDAEGLLPELRGKAEGNFYNLKLHRKFCKSILSANISEENHYRNIAQARNLELHSPLAVIRQKTPLHTNSSPRVAICVSGQLRGIEKSSKSVLSELTKKTNGHVFIDTWKTQRSNFPTFTRVQRLIGNELWNILPAEVKMPDGFRHYFPRTTKSLTSPITSTVTSDYVRKYLPESTIRIEDEAVFEKQVSDQAAGLTLRGNLNQAKMFYKINKCHELIDRYSSDEGIEFDVVIRTRPDLDISFPAIKEYIEAAHNNPNVIYVSYVTALGYGDQFAIGSKKAMDVYASIWERIWNKKRFKYTECFDPQVASFAGESLTANHLLFQGIDVRHIKPEKSNFTTLLSINAVDIANDLQADIASSDIKQLLEPFHNKYIEMRAAGIEFT